MSQFNRRTLVRGAAWSIPVVAVATHAPAFATSPLAAPRPAAVTACRETASSKCYRFALSFAQPSADWTLTLSSVILTNTSTPDGEEVIVQTTPKTIQLSSTGPAIQTFQIQACTTGNLQSAVKVRFTYTATSPARSEQVVVTYDLTNIDPCK